MTLTALQDIKGMNKNLLMFNTGSAQYSDTTIADSCYIEEAEILNAAEYISTHFNLSSEAEFSGEIEYINTDLLNQAASHSPDGNQEWTVEQDFPIMIQARWHKKVRVRKKWLKRYGMKCDLVKVRYTGLVLIQNVQGDYCDFEFNADKMEYLWRPNQKRRGLKIEWV